MGRRSQAIQRERYGVDSSGWDGNPIPRHGPISPVFGLGIEDSGADNIGFETGVYGTLAPATLEGIEVSGIYVQPLGDNAIFALSGGLPIPSIGIVDPLQLFFEGFTSNPASLSWDVRDNQYVEIGNSALTAYFVSNIGNVVAFSLEPLSGFSSGFSNGF